MMSESIRNLRRLVQEARIRASARGSARSLEWWTTASDELMSFERLGIMINEVIEQAPQGRFAVNDADLEVLRDAAEELQQITGNIRTLRQESSGITHRFGLKFAHNWIYGAALLLMRRLARPADNDAFSALLIDFLVEQRAAAPSQSCLRRIDEACAKADSALARVKELAPAQV